jgi:hypothetical protein
MTKRKTTTPEPTAAETYAARRNDIGRLIDVLQMELDKHAEQAKADPKNWGRTSTSGRSAAT